MARGRGLYGTAGYVKRTRLLNKAVTIILEHTTRSKNYEAYEVPTSFSFCKTLAE